jgi:hypothetical protein
LILIFSFYVSVAVLPSNLALIARLLIQPWAAPDTVRTVAHLPGSVMIALFHLLLRGDIPDVLHAGVFALLPRNRPLI